MAYPTLLRLVIAYLLNVSVMVCGSDSQLWYCKHYTCKRRSQVPHEITVFCKTINRERGRRGKRLPAIWHCNWMANEVSRDLEGEEELKVAITLHRLLRSHLGTAASPGGFVRVNFISRRGSDTPWWQAAVCGWWWWLMELTVWDRAGGGNHLLSWPSPLQISCGKTEVSTVCFLGGETNGFVAQLQFVSLANLIVLCKVLLCGFFSFFFPSWSVILKRKAVKQK